MVSLSNAKITLVSRTIMCNWNL